MTARIEPAIEPAVRLLHDLAAWWAKQKLILGDSLRVSPDALHVHASVLFLAAFAAVFRRPFADGRAWLALLAIETANEALDLMLDGMGSTEATLGSGLHDLVNTMIAPTVLAVTMRFLRKRQVDADAWRR